MYTRRDPVGAGRGGRREQHAAACSWSRRAAAAVCCSSRARPGSSTRSSSARWRATPASRWIRWSARARPTTGRPTFFVQAAASRAAALAAGYPHTRAELFAYDAVVFGNIEAGFFTHDQLDATAAFVSARGGGLLVLGGAVVRARGPGRHAARRSAAGRHVRPPRHGGARPPNAAPAAPASAQLTSDGADHPATRIGASRRRGAPALGRAAGAGVDLARRRAASGRAGARPDRGRRRRRASARGGAALRPGPRDGLCRRGVVALAHDAAGGRHHLRHRSGASWRAGSRAARWTRCRWRRFGSPSPGTTEAVSVLVRDEEFAPVRDAEVQVRVTLARRRRTARDGRAHRCRRRPIRGQRAVRRRRRLPGHGRGAAGARAARRLRARDARRAAPIPKWPIPG